MIRLDQRNVDVQGTERVFKKVVHSGQNAIRFVDKDGVPMRVPNTSALSRLHSTYTLSPRGVPIRKSNHSYSGQLTQGKMQNMVNSLETTSQEMTSYTSMHSYGNGLSSAGSSRHYLSTANSQKRRSIGPPRSVKSMAKSASSQRSKRMLVSAPGLDSSVEPELENTNESPQGKRLGKEWSALSQCRALKRSSEIVSHRVDRMYFMSGNKLKLQSKYHVEDNELRHLRELQAARASSRASRSGASRKGDVYKPHISGSQQAGLNNGDAGTVVVSDEAKRANRLAVENGHKENSDPQILVSQKTLTARPNSISKSPIQGWGGEDEAEKEATVANGDVNETALHDNVQEKAEEEFKGQNVFVTNAIEQNRDTRDQGKGDIVENGDDMKEDNDNMETGVVNSDEKTKQDNQLTEKIENLEIVTEGKGVTDDGRKDEKGNDDATSVHKTEETSDSSDKDKTEVKTEDYLGK